MTTISNAELLTDIELTRKEIEAYQMLYDGYGILAMLPENVEAGTTYRFELLRYSKLKEQCSGFLQDLLSLKKERNLE
jgi:hypothetical protein